MANNVIDGNGSGKIAVVGYYLAGSEPEVVADRWMSIREKVRCRSVAVCNLIEERHAAHSVRKTLIFQQDNEDVIESRQ